MGRGGLRDGRTARRRTSPANGVHPGLVVYTCTTPEFAPPLLSSRLEVERRVARPLVRCLMPLVESMDVETGIVDVLHLTMILVSLMQYLKLSPPQTLWLKFVGTYGVVILSNIW
ncbi:uncharacterized protein LOC120640593 [Panicum virgatum]|uniref:uncharacterized protein LOC120640593 n=1 Tax=Panicum virgatum TaxID=38727 RepID=UPI0019D4F1C2|nr:uncharacterized protein LOC120640593 [Panicum virgatum]